jgi:hypothetical protein
MAYVPDGITARRRKEDLSYTAFEIFHLHCEAANQDTGFSFVSIKTIAETLGIRLDNAKKYNSELISKKWIVLGSEAQHQGVYMRAGWLSRKDRIKKSQPPQEQKAPPETESKQPENTPQTLVNSLNFSENDIPEVQETPQSLGKISQSLVNSPQSLGKISQSLVTAQQLQNSEVFSEPAHLTSPLNQPIEPVGEEPTGSHVEKGENLFGELPKKSKEKSPKPWGKLGATEAEYAQVQECFDYWKSFHQKPRAKLLVDEDRWTATLKRLRDGYTVEEIQSGIRGLKHSPHHQGQNDRNTKYDDLFHVCKSPENLEKFIQLDSDSQSPNGRLSKVGQANAIVAQRYIERKFGNGRT